MIRPQYRPAPPIAVRFLDVPRDCPDDVRELAQLVAVDGPELLVGHDPATAALVAIHPRSQACPMAAALLGRASLSVVRLADLVALSAELRAQIRPRRGWFSALLVGARHKACVRLAPAETAWRKGAA